MDARDYPHAELSAVVIGAFYETYNALGFGFLESVYENAFLVQLEHCGLRVERQRPGIAVGECLLEARTPWMAAALE